MTLQREMWRKRLFGWLLKKLTAREATRAIRAATARERWRSTGGLAALLAMAGLPLYAQEGAAPALPDGDGKELVATACSQCHSLRPILMLRYGREGWKDMVQEMVIRGAQLLPEEADTVVRYLFTNFGPGRNIMETGTLPPQTALGETASTKEIALPPGPGKQDVEGRCGICHDLGRVVTVRRSRADWEAVTRDMISLGPPAPPEQVQAIISYLSSQFGADDK